MSGTIPAVDASSMSARDFHERYAASGMPETWQIAGEEKKTLANSEGVTGSAIGIGEYEMRPINQAVGFATFASGGIYRAPHFITGVADSEGTVLLTNAGEAGEQVIRADVANDVTYAIEDVADHSDRTLDGGREVASKTGTQGLDREDNSDAWMVGYTPSISTAVWIGTDQREPIRDLNERPIFGAALPGQIWQQYMNAVLNGTPEEDLPDEPMIDGDTGEGVPAPEPQRAPEPTETSAPPSTPAPEEEEETPDPATTDEDGDGVTADQDPDDNDPDVPNAPEPVDEDGDGVTADQDPDDNDPDVPNAPEGEAPEQPGNGGGGNGNG